MQVRALVLMPQKAYEPNEKSVSWGENLARPVACGPGLGSPIADRQHSG